jgi:hypothetical protein
MIKRDEYFIICQSNANYPDQMDGGDSSRSTGLMAMAGHPLDRASLDEFIIDGKLVRHPYQQQWNKPELTSRDQVLTFAAGVSDFEGDARDAMLDYAKGWFVNKDILLPHNKLALYKCSSYGNPGLFITVFGYMFMFLHLLHACFIAPKEEQNQTIAMLSRFPTMMRWYLKWHGGVEQNVTDYFSGYPWRDQPEIAASINKYLQRFK